MPRFPMQGVSKSGQRAPEGKVICVSEKRRTGLADLPAVEEMEGGAIPPQVLEDRPKSSEGPRARHQALAAGGVTPDEEALENDGLKQKECRECGERMWVMDNRVELCGECYQEEEDMFEPRVDEEEEYGLVGEY